VLLQLGFLDGHDHHPRSSQESEETQKNRAREEVHAREILTFYRGLVNTISGLLPGGSVSVEVYADKTTTAEKMLPQEGRMFSWVRTPMSNSPRPVKD